MTAEMPAALRDAIDRGAEDVVALLIALVQRPTENPPGETADAMEWLAGELERRGHRVERHPVPTPFARPAKRSDLVNLVARRRFGPGPTLALHAPLDTLPAGAASGWYHDPFGAEIVDGALHGRGSRDSKADVAAYVGVVEALAAAGASAGTVELHITADEESGGFLGPAFLLGQDIVRPDAVIGAGTSHQVITGQQGVLQLEVLLRGRQAHASRPGDGRDAIAAALPILAMLAAPGDAGRPPLTVTTLEAGKGINTVAEELRFTLDRRLDQGEDGDQVEAVLTEQIHGALEAEGISVEVRRLLLAEPVSPTAESNALAKVLAAHGSVEMGAAVPVVSAPVVSGARHYAAAGIATALYGVGPPIVGEGVDFTGDESVRLDDLARASRALAGAAWDILKG